MSFVAAHQVPAKQRIDSSTEEVTFVLDPEDFLALACGVRGRVLDGETGAPLAATVRVGDFGPESAVAADGTFTIEDTQPGEQKLIVRAPDRASVRRMVTLTPGEIHEAGDIPLLPAVSLSGSVRRATGGPLEARLDCGLLDPSTGAVRWPRNIAYGTKSDGTFTITNLEPGLYVLRSPGLRATSPRPHDPSMMSRPQRVDATGGSVEGIELVLHATTAITLVAENVGEPWPHVTARDAAGLPVRSAWPGRWGTETLLHLPPGSFTLEIERDGVVLEWRPLVVGEEPQRLVLNFD